MTLVEDVGLLEGTGSGVADCIPYRGGGGDGELEVKVALKLLMLRTSVGPFIAGDLVVMLSLHRSWKTWARAFSASERGRA